MRAVTGIIPLAVYIILHPTDAGFPTVLIIAAEISVIFICPLPILNVLNEYLLFSLVQSRFHPLLWIAGYFFPSVPQRRVMNRPSPIHSGGILIGTGSNIGTNPSREPLLAQLRFKPAVDTRCTNTGQYKNENIH